jgi:hypothetical protein
MAASRSPEPFPAATETRIAEFADLVATAISNAQSRAELAASRAHAPGMGTTIAVQIPAEQPAACW